MPFVTCGCLSRRDSTGYQCIQCPVGQVQDPNNVNQCITQPACDEYSYNLPRDTNSCGRCQRCNWPTQIVDPVSRNRCVARPVPTCNCNQRYGDGGYSCIDCPYGQLRHSTNRELCVNAPTCSGTNQIQLAIDSQSCGRCQTCQWPMYIPDATRTQCILRPKVTCPSCLERESADGYSCEKCPAGQVTMPNNPKACYTPTCTQQYSYRLAINEVSCGACETCQWPVYIVNP